MPSRRLLSAGLGAAAVVAAIAAWRGPEPFPLDLGRPLGRAWRVIQPWDEDVEEEYGRFVAAIGAGVAAWRCTRLDACLADPTVNPLLDPRDPPLRLEVDCADLPYVLRAYFAFKRGLPFGFVAGVRSASVGDLRFADDLRAGEWRSFRDYPNARQLLVDVTRRVHTGMYRLPAGAPGDFYPVRVAPASIRPGTVFYDPLGHVSVVAEVRDDGNVFFLEGTPYGNLTWRRFGSGNRVGEAGLGGGFKRFRPQSVVRGRLVRVDGADHDPVGQYQRHGVPFHDWVRASLASASPLLDPVDEAREMMRALCRDVRDRVEAVELAARAGLPSRRHPRALPDNVYLARGDWESYSTPARDARLKVSVRELADHLRASEDLPGLGPALRDAWREETARPWCRFAYHDSQGAAVPLSLDRVLDRLFDLSFDPYHCPELRWGAPAGSIERASCPPDADKDAWYAAERRLRNRVDRDFAADTPLDAGPDEPPDDVDPRPLFIDRRADLEL